MEHQFRVALRRRCASPETMKWCRIDPISRLAKPFCQARLESEQLANIHDAFADAIIPPSSMNKAIKSFVLTHEWARRECREVPVATRAIGSPPPRTRVLGSSSTVRLDVAQNDLGHLKIVAHPSLPETSHDAIAILHLAILAHLPLTLKPGDG